MNPKENFRQTIGLANALADSDIALDRIKSAGDRREISAAIDLLAAANKMVRVVASQAFGIVDSPYIAPRADDAPEDEGCETQEARP